MSWTPFPRGLRKLNADWSANETCGGAEKTGGMIDDPQPSHLSIHPSIQRGGEGSRRLSLLGCPAIGRKSSQIMKMPPCALILPSSMNLVGVSLMSGSIIHQLIFATAPGCGCQNKENPLRKHRGRECVGCQTH